MLSNKHVASMDRNNVFGRSVSPGFHGLNISTVAECIKVHMESIGVSSSSQGFICFLLRSSKYLYSTPQQQEYAINCSQAKPYLPDQINLTIAWHYILYKIHIHSSFAKA